MDRLKKIAKIAIIMLSGIATINTLIVLSLLTFIACYSITDGPWRWDKPTVTKGEFPFKLTYETEGEIKTAEDIIVCEFDGFTEKKINWKSYFKKNEEKLTLLELKETEDSKQIKSLYFSHNPVGYLMGEDVKNTYSQEAVGSLWYIYEITKTDGTIVKDVKKCTFEEAWEKYRLKIISFECAPPIENEFVKR